MNLNDADSPGAEVLRYVRAGKRKLQYILLPIVLVPCATAVSLSFIAPVYESSSVVIYEEKLPFARSMGDMIVQKPEPGYRENDRLAQIEARLKSAIFLGEVTQKLNVRLAGDGLKGLRSAKTPGVSPEELKKSILVESLRKSIKIAETGPDLFKITISNADRDVAFRLTDGVTRLFVDYVTRGQVADIRAAGTFSQDQLPVYEEKLRQSEERLRQYRSQTASRSAGESTSSGQGLQQARSVLDQTEAEIAELGSHRKTAKETMDANYPNAVDPVTLIRSGAIGSAYAGVTKEEEAGVSLLAQGVSTASVMERVGLARERLLSAIQQTVSSTLKGSPESLLSLVTEQVYDDYVIRSLETRRSQVSGLIARYSRAAGRRPKDDTELARLEQEVEANNSVLQSLRNQLTSSQISEAAQSTRLGVRIEIIEPASRPLTQAGPAKRKIMILALLLGPFLGLSFAVLSEYMDDSVKSVGDISKHLGIPVLGTIPKVPGTGFWQPSKVKRWPYIVIIAALIFTTGIKLGHGPILAMLGRERQGIVAGELSGTDGKTSAGNEQARDDN